MIPFCEWFIFPYFSWYIVVPVALSLLMFKNREDFLRLCFLMFGGMTIALFIYLIAPNSITFRADIINDNIASKICKFLYALDAPTNVCPSIHVSSSVAIDMAIQKSETFGKNIPVRIISFIIMILISLSTMFVKQHSFTDAAAGLLVSLILFIIAFRTPFSKVFESKKTAAFTA